MADFQFHISLNQEGRKTEEKNKKQIFLAISNLTQSRKKKNRKNKKLIFLAISNLTQSEEASSSVGLSPHGRLSHEPDCAFVTFDIIIITVIVIIIILSGHISVFTEIKVTTFISSID